ncbi:hypothetical protein [Nonomuraea sp. NPDC002799]
MTVFAAAVLLTSGCGPERSGTSGSGPGEAGPGSPGQAQPVITPEGRLVSSEDSGDLPEATAQVGLDCQKLLDNRDFTGAATKMDEVAAAAGSSDGERAVAQVCGAAAKANLRQWDQALEDVDAANEHPEDLPPQMRPQLRMLLDETELVSAVALDDRDRVRRVVARLKKLGRIPDEHLRNACLVASDPATLPECAAITPSSATTGPPPGGESPSNEPTPRPEESGTEPTTGPTTGPTTEPTTGPTSEPTETGGATEPPDEDDSTPQDDTGPAPNES